MTTATTPPAAPASPCINICTIGTDGCCTGCRRTLAEIAGWPRMGADEKWAVIRAIAAREDWNGRR
ncbi:MAG: DUF1289 domain-containing protein [Steroidobacteraceae bacterium]